MHSAHQGALNMLAHAVFAVWWLGMLKDVACLKAECQLCLCDAPS